MKKLFILAVLAGMMGAISSVSAMVLFFDDFERTALSSGGNDNWINPGSNGRIVNNPGSDAVNGSARVLNFSAVDAGGDLFSSTQIALTAGQKYIAEFDYYGQSATPGTSGGFAGLANGTGTGTSPAGNHIWYAGTTPSALSSGIGAITLPDLDNWIHISYLFTSPVTGSVGNSIRLMFEDFSGSGSTAGDAFFDNVQLSSVPLPTALPLFGSGLALMGFIGWRRKRSRIATA